MAALTRWLWQVGSDRLFWLVALISTFYSNKHSVNFIWPILRTESALSGNIWGQTPWQLYHTSNIIVSQCNLWIPPTKHCAIRIGSKFSHCTLSARLTISHSHTEYFIVKTLSLTQWSYTSVPGINHFWGPARDKSGLQGPTKNFSAAFVGISESNQAYPVLPPWYTTCKIQVIQHSTGIWIFWKFLGSNSYAWESSTANPIDL